MLLFPIILHYFRLSSKNTKNPKHDKCKDTHSAHGAYEQRLHCVYAKCDKARVYMFLYSLET